MASHIDAWLHDILSSIEEIETYFENKHLVFSDYQNDRKTKRAI